MPKTTDPKDVQGALVDQKCFILGENDLRDPILVKFSRWKNQDRISIRAHYWGKTPPALRPTRRGVEIPLAYLDVLIEVLKILSKDLRESKTL